MVLHFLELPPELREYIYKYCSTHDLLMLGCCSKALYNSLKYIIWRVVKIPWTDLENISLPSTVENLKHTNHLRLYENNHCDDISDDDDNATDNCKIKNESWRNILSNYSKLLNYCDANKLTRLSIVGLATTSLEIKQTVSLLKNLKELSFTCTRYVFDIDWKLLSTCRNLKKLCLQKCGIDDDGVKHVTKCEKLEELHLELCYLMRDDSMKYISKVVNLKKLSILQSSLISSDMFKYIGNLNKLFCLRLENTNITNEILIYLCEHLTNLQILNIGGKYITDEGFKKISLLHVLVELNIEMCFNITDSCFVYLDGLTSLQKISFSSTNLTDIVFSHLLKLRSVKELNITNVNFSFSDDVLEEYCKSADMKKTHENISWMLSFLVLSKEI